MSWRWVYWFLCAAALALVVTNVALHLRGATTRGADSAQAVLGATLTAKVALLGDAALGGQGGTYSEMVVQSLEQAERDPALPVRARALRRKAIWCAFEHLECTGPALDALAAIPAAERLPAPADEALVLREALSGAPIPPERVDALDARLAEVRLGWFDALKRERLFRNAGDDARADAELARARSGAVSSVVAIFAMGGIFGVGGIAWLVVAFLPARRRVLSTLAEHLREPETLADADAARLMALFVTFLGGALLLGPAVRWLGVPAPTTPLGSALQALSGEAVIGLLVLAVHRALSLGAGPPPVLGFRGSSVKRALGAGGLVYLLLLPAIVVILIPISALFQRLGIPTQSHPIVDQLQASSGNLAALAVWLVVASVAAPLLEEAVFRGALQRSLRARFGGGWSVAISSVAFAVIHPQVGIGLVGVLVIGVAVALVREHERSLWPSVVVHALNNGVALALAMGMLSG